MASIQITTKIGCSNACAYCPQDRFVAAYRTRSDTLAMSFDTFVTCISKIPLDVDIIFAGMCEPWLNPACTSMLQYAHDRGHRIGVFTTLAGMQLSDLDVLKTIPFSFFRVHLPSERGWEKINTDQEYLSLLDGLLRSGIKAQYHWHGGGVRSEEGALLRRSAGKAELRSLYSRAGNYTVSKKPYNGRKRGSLRGSRRLRCNVLMPNGDIALCSNDYGLKHVLGNLFNESYESLFLGETFLMIERCHCDESLDFLCR